MRVGARLSSVGTDQEPRDRQGWQTLEENTSCVHTGIWAHCLRKEKKSFLGLLALFSKISLKLPQLEDTECKQ